MVIVNHTIMTVTEIRIWLLNATKLGSCFWRHLNVMKDGIKCKLWYIYFKFNWSILIFMGYSILHAFIHLHASI